MSLSISFLEDNALLVEIDTSCPLGDQCFVFDFNLNGLQELDV